MKRLAIVRHAKSDWSDPDAKTDHDRPLNKRGRAAAPTVGAELSRLGLRPKLMVSSTAVRAASTARAIAEELDYDPETVVLEPELYHASADGWQRIAAGFDNGSDIDCAMMFGHWPGAQDFVHHLTGGSEIDRFVTCSVALLDLDIDDWAEIDAGCGKLVRFFTPHGL